MRSSGLLFGAMLFISQPLLAHLFGAHDETIRRTIRRLADVDVPYTQFASRDGQSVLRHLLTANTGVIQVHKLDNRFSPAKQVSETYDLSDYRQRTQIHKILERAANPRVISDIIMISAKDIVTPKSVEKHILSSSRTKIGSRLAWVGLAGAITWVIWEKMNAGDVTQSPSSRSASGKR